MVKLLPPASPEESASPPSSQEGSAFSHLGIGRIQIALPPSGPNTVPPIFSIFLSNRHNCTASKSLRLIRSCPCIDSPHKSGGRRAAFCHQLKVSHRGLYYPRAGRSRGGPPLPMSQSYMVSMLCGKAAVVAPQDSGHRCKEPVEEDSAG